MDKFALWFGLVVYHLEIVPIPRFSGSDLDVARPEVLCNAVRWNPSLLHTCPDSEIQKSLPTKYEYICTYNSSYLTRRFSDFSSKMFVLVNSLAFFLTLKSTNAHNSFNFYIKMQQFVFCKKYEKEILKRTILITVLVISTYLPTYLLMSSLKKQVKVLERKVQ